MRPLKLFALIAVILIPMLMIGAILYERHEAPVYKVRIEGYDPRDLLYGHYLTFRFAPEISAARETFPADFSHALNGFDGRYYIPEQYALTLEKILRDDRHHMEIGVGVPERGKPFLHDLYIDDIPMRRVLRNFENGIDFDSNAERQ